MRKFILGLLVIGFSMAQANAQGSARQYSGTVKYQKTDQPCTIIEVPYPAKQVEEGLMAKGREQGVSVRQRNGFYEARNWRKSGEVYDMYYKVEKSGKNGSKIYAILTNPGEDVVNRTSSHAALASGVAAGGAVMAAVAPMLGEHDLDVTQKALEDEIAKMEKKMKGLQDDMLKLEKKRTELEEQITKNTTDQTNLTTELEAKKAGLTKFMEQKGRKN